MSKQKEREKDDEEDEDHWAMTQDQWCNLTSQ